MRHGVSRGAAHASGYFRPPGRYKPKLAPERPDKAGGEGRGVVYTTPLSSQAF
jgi:hypothetical protein